jgi:hypothetical protein
MKTELRLTKNDRDSRGSYINDHVSTTELV